jgi:hypothetical protein
MPRAKTRWTGRATRSRSFRFTVGVCVALMEAGCTRAPLNPPRLVMSSDTDMAIQLFMQSTILLSNYYGYSTIKYSEIQARSRRAGLDTIPFMAPETIRATPQLINFVNDYDDNPAALNDALQRLGGYKNLVKYYIRTGLRASQSICRSYLLDLDEKSEYLQFLEKEVGVGYALSSAVLALVHANTTLTTSFLIARTGFDGAIDAYGDYRFLNIDREAARALVEAAQNSLAQYFLQQVDKTAADPNLVTGGYTFSDALHAVSTIEYQCTRSGIRALLARSINNSPANLVVDQDTGNLTFRSAAGAPIIASEQAPSGSGSGGSGGNPNAMPGAKPQAPNPGPAKQKQTDNGQPANNDSSGSTRVGQFEKNEMKPDDLKTALTVLCRTKDPDLGPKGSPARKALSAFLVANQKTPSEVLTKDVMFDLRDLQLGGKTSCS